MIKKEMTLGGRNFSIETGRMAKQASGSVVVRYEDTMVLVTAESNLTKESDLDYFPLQVEYRSKTYAAGKIPGGFLKREGRPSDRDVLTARLIDRPIRPLFPDGFKSETQIIAYVISSDMENPGDVLGMVGASAALSISEIPFLEPIAGVRVGRIDNEFVINPTVQQMEKSEIEIIVSGNEESVLMVEGEANEVSEELLVDAIEFAHKTIVELINLQKELIAEINPVKHEVTAPEVNEALVKIVTEKTQPQLEEWRKLGKELKKVRSTAIAKFKDNLIKELEEEFPEQGGKIAEILDDILKADVRENIIENQERLDGRGLENIRPITCEVGVLPRAHGSALFTRGETQSLGTMTLGTKLDEQIIDDVGTEEYRKKFTLHYNFPPFCVGETGWIRGPGRREIGHGNLAERALKYFVPDTEDFPYTIRIVSDILESNGSSSMASVCAGSLSMMEGGVPLEKTVAGIAMGLIVDGDNHYVLSDILGAEDHYGDMDFKVTGSKEGVTAIQMDLKVNGISTDIMRTALEQARNGRVHIIDIMNKCIDKPNEDISRYAPKILSMQIDKEMIGEIIGPGGKRIRAIQEETNSTVEIDDEGVIFISSVNSEASERAKKIIEGFLEKPEEGKIYQECPINRIEDYGAFVEFLPGTDGLLHVSEVAWKRTEDIKKVLKVGQKVDVKLKKIAGQGRFELSIKELKEKPEGYVERKRERPKYKSNNRRDDKRRDRSHRRRS